MVTSSVARLSDSLGLSLTLSRQRLRNQYEHAHNKTLKQDNTNI